MTEKSPFAGIPDIVNLADGEGSRRALRGPSDKWKFVIVQIASRLHLVLGPVSRYRYHANLVDSFCHRHDIPASTARGSRRVAIYDRSVRVLGGGYIRLDVQSRWVRFYGQSTTYGPYEADAVSSILKEGNLFSGYSVHVD